MFDLTSSGVGTELSGDFSNQISLRGGFHPSANMNLAYFYEDTREVYYLGYMDELSIRVHTPSYDIFGFGMSRKYGTGVTKVEIECSVWQTDKTVRNTRNIIDKYLEVYGSNNCIGTLIGYIDLINGDQFRFLMPGFLLTDYEHEFSFGISDLIRTNLRGQPTYYLASNNKWDLIEEQKKIDYSTIKTIEHL